MPIQRISHKAQDSDHDEKPLVALDCDQPSSSSGLRDLQTKAKNKDTRARAASVGSIYPQSKDDRTKARSKSKPRDEREQPTKPMPKRGPNGRFVKS